MITPRPIRVFLVDDHSFYRFSLKKALSRYPHVEVCGEATDGKEFICQMTTIDADIILMDVRMKEIDGIAATRMATNMFNSMKIIGISFYRQREYCMELIEAGVKGVLFKDSPMYEIIEAIETVYRGGTYFASDIHSVFFPSRD